MNQYRRITIYLFICYVQADESVIKAIVAALTAEDQALGLELPPGVGQRPWLLQVDCYPNGKQLYCFCNQFLVKL